MKNLEPPLSKNGLASLAGFFFCSLARNLDTHFAWPFLNWRGVVIHPFDWLSLVEGNTSNVLEFITRQLVMALSNIVPKCWFVLPCNPSIKYPASLLYFSCDALGVVWRSFTFSVHQSLLWLRLQIFIHPLFTVSKLCLYYGTYFTLTTDTRICWWKKLKAVVRDITKYCSWFCFFKRISSGF